jgi:predicted metal-dependent hydrolase
MQIEHDGLLVTLFRKRVKHLNIRIQRTGVVHVSAPMRAPLSVIHQFLQEKREWIVHHQRRLQAVLPDPVVTIKTGDIIFLWGLRYALVVHEVPKKKTPEIIYGTLHLFVQSDAAVDERRRLLNHWYGEQMKQHLPALFAKWEAVVGVHAHRYTIKLMKTRWGSCHPLKKCISLSLQLAQKPLICLEYVIVHELVHLLEASHNQRFYALMSQFMPGWQEAKGRLST